MVQSLRHDLHRYHDLFSGGRCQGWELEELIVRAIKSDAQANHHPLWRESGHDDKADIVIHQGTRPHYVTIKSGRSHVYRLAYVSAALLGGIDADGWKMHGKQ